MHKNNSVKITGFLIQIKNLNNMMFSIALALLALTGGMFLLAKTKKDNLGLSFKIISYFIIIASFLNLACTAAHGAMKFYGRSYCNHEMMMHEKFMKDDMGSYHHGMGRYGNECCERYEGSCMKDNRYGGYWGKDKKDSCCIKQEIEKNEKK
jgi:hypothetical protein